MVFLYPINLFEGLFIIPVSCNGFYYDGATSCIEVEIKFKPKFMHIAIIFENFQGGIIQLMKMFCLKFHKVHLNRLRETIVLNFYCSVLIELVYNIFIKWIIVHYLNVKAKTEANF